MTVSDSSSSNDPRSAPPHRRLSLRGRSLALDPATHAVRIDLVDLDLADRVLASHYARAVDYRAKQPTAVRRTADCAAEPVVTLAEGADFRVLDCHGGWSWGRTSGQVRVGYVESSQLSLV